MSKKNIMLLIGNLNNGGAENSIVKLGNELAKKHNVYLLVASAKNQDYKTNMPIFEIPELTKKRTKLKGILKIRKLKKELNINTSISYTTVFNFINIASKYKDKVVISIRNYLSLKEKEKLYKLIHILSARFCDLIVCCSKAVKDDQIKNYKINKNKLVVIENFCNPKEIKELSKEKVDVNNFIVSIARLEKHKGLIELIEAFKTVTKEKQNLKLLIFGRGPLKKEINNLIQNLKLEKNVILKGFTSNPYKYLKNARCFVLTSYYEGFSNSIIEAMTCSCPVVATNSPGGNRETLTNSNYHEKQTYGILIKNHNPNEIAKAIIKAVNNYDYYSKKSYQRSKDFTNEKIMRKWYEVL